MSAEWTAELVFDTDDPEFCRGVEFGLLYQQLIVARRTGHPISIKSFIHTSNAEMAIRLAEAHNLRFRVEDTKFDGNEEWLALVLEDR